MRFGIAAALVLMTACGHPQRLPVAIQRCDAVATRGGYSIAAFVENRSTKPISAMRVAVDFYLDFRYVTVAGSARLPHALDPGARQTITFVVGPAGPERVQGRAMRCLATHIEYLDGTTEDVPPAR